MDSEKRLKIAIQKSGRLADMSLQLLEKCGIQLSKSRDQLLCRSQNFPLDVFWFAMMTSPHFGNGCLPTWRVGAKCAS